MMALSQQSWLVRFDLRFAVKRIPLLVLSFALITPLGHLSQPRQSLQQISKSCPPLLDSQLPPNFVNATSLCLSITSISSTFSSFATSDTTIGSNEGQAYQERRALMIQSSVLQGWQRRKRARRWKQCLSPNTFCSKEAKTSMKSSFEWPSIASSALSPSHRRGDHHPE